MALEAMDTVVYGTRAWSRLRSGESVDGVLALAALHNITLAIGSPLHG
ncbi:hypothetical protein ACWC5I_17275 [Kitasatospora sp. NPDC001574]